MKPEMLPDGDMDVTGRGYYILDAKHQPVAQTSLLTWAFWFEEHQADRIVKQEALGPCFISTVFLGLDHAHGAMGMGGPHRPILFETMVFTGRGVTGTIESVGVQARCATWEEAESMHKRVVEEIRQAVTG